MTTKMKDNQVIWFQSVRVGTPAVSIQTNQPQKENPRPESEVSFN